MSDLSNDMRQQIADCKALRARGQTYQQMIANGYAARAALIAFDRDPEGVCPYAGQGEAGHGAS